MKFFLIQPNLLGPYDQIPIDMEGLELESHGGGNGSTYSAMDVETTEPDLNFDQLPTPPQDNGQVAAWYDTDL